jgi:HEAT repeat protein
MDTTRLLRRLADALDVHSGEGRLIALLLCFSFCNGLVRTFMRSAAYGLFLAVFSAQTLPYVYIGVSVFASLASFGYLRIAQRVPLSRLLIGTLCAIILALGALWVGVGARAGAWLIFGLPIFYEILLMMTNLALWNTAGRLFNVQQGKRLFGLIGAGEPTASVVGGFLTAPIVALIGTPNLLLLAAGIVVVALLVASVLVREHRPLLARAGDANASRRPAGSAQILKNRYVLLIFSLYTLAIISYFFVDNIFFAQAQRQYADANELAGFIGVFYAFVGIVWTLTNALVIGALFKRYGLRAALIVAPAALGASALAIVVAGSIGAALVVVFWLAALAKLLSRLSFDGLVKMSLNVIYQPLRPAQRVRTQTLNEGLVYAGAVGITGLLLTALTNLLKLSSIQLSGVLLAVLGVWLVIAVLLLREYPRQLLRALAHRWLDGGGDLAFVDPASGAILRRALADPHPDVALYALRALTPGDTGAMPDYLPGLLRHPAPAVRRATLEEIAQRRMRATLQAVRPLLHDLDPAVRGAAARALAALDGAAALDDLRPLLGDGAAPARLGATVGLLRDGGIAGILAAGQQLLSWGASNDPAERELAARALGEVGVATFDQPLDDLLHDPDAGVRRAALAAAGRLASPRLVPGMLAALATPATAKAAVAALSMAGAATLPALGSAFATGDRMVQIGLAQICGRVGGPEAIALLLPRLEHPDPTVRTHILRALVRCGFRAAAADRPRLLAYARGEIGRAAWVVAALAACGESCGPLLPRALAAEIAAAQERVLFALSMLADAQALDQARVALASASAEQRAYAIEIVDTQVPQELKALVIPLMSDLPPASKLQRLAALLPQRALDRDTLLTEIAATANGQLSVWTRACALQAIGELRLAELAHVVAAAGRAPEPLLRETAQWAASRIAAPFVPPDTALRKGTSPMLSRIERVLILKTVAIFAETPDDVLAEVAALLDEADVAAGKPIFHKGDSGTSMYFIVDGEVRVHDGTHTLNHLHARDAFGEMALLDPEPRSASVTAITDTHLLRLDQEPFYELVEEHNYVARGIIRVLTRHLRARVRDLADARAQISAPATNLA